jgi:hypothetical protein
MRILKPFLLSLAAAGLVAAATASVNAETLTSPWSNSPGGGEFQNSGNIVVWYVDIPPTLPNDLTIAANWTAGWYSFRAQQQCANGTILSGTWGNVFFNATGTVESRTPSCTSRGGTFRGRVQIAD